MSTNPYQSPLPYSPGTNFTHTNIRPTSGTVFGILNIVFGSLGICGMIFTVGMLLVPQNPNVPNPVIEIMNENPGYRVFQNVGIGLGFIATTVLIVAGIGLLKLKPFGRKLSIGYGIYVIISALVGFVVNWIFLLGPLMEKMNTLPPGPAQAGAIGGLIGGVAGPCIGLVYPVLLLIFMFRKNVIEAYRG